MLYLIIPSVIVFLTGVGFLMFERHQEGVRRRNVDGMMYDHMTRTDPQAADVWKKYGKAAAQRYKELRNTRGLRFATANLTNGELFAEFDDLIYQSGLEIGNYLNGRGLETLLAVDTTGTHLFIAGRTGSKVTGRIFRAEEILSVDRIADIKTTVTRLGIDGVVFGSYSHSELKGVWLKLLVHDVRHPWLVFSMPDMRTANEWLGVIKLVAHQGTRPNLVYPLLNKPVALPVYSIAPVAPAKQLPASQQMVSEINWGENNELVELIPLGRQ